MFACKNCGGNVKFDIKSGQLACEYCHSLFDPYAYEDKTSDAEVQKDFDATIFTCPQCGGEILSTDDTAAGFCSFCGASTVLYSRMQKEHKPAYIIPFAKSKDDCKQAYMSLMKKAIFAPKELKDPKFIDGFRGIYMPYWTYYVTQKAPISLPAKRSHRSGDYIITDHFRLEGDLDAYYKGLSYDASSSFDDSISEKLAPYDVKNMKRFTPKDPKDPLHEQNKALYDMFLSIKEGMRIHISQIEKAVRLNLREFMNCDLTNKKKDFYVRFGFDYYMTFNSNIDKSILKKEIEKIGLYFNPRG